MYLKVSNKFADSDFYFLEKFLRMIDTELSEIDKQIKQSKDPDSDGLCDLGEYFIGYGFIAIQRYITSTYPQTSFKKMQSLKLGHKINDDLYLLEAINAGANYWKHENEWPFPLNEGEPDDKGMIPIEIDRTGSNLKGIQKITYDTITKITPYADYTLSNLLAGIVLKTTNTSNLNFSVLLSFIKEWRKKLDVENQKHKEEEEASQI